MKLDKDNNKMEALFLQCIEADPCSGYACYSYGQFLWKKRKNFKSAKIFIEASVELCPSEPHFLKELQLLAKDRRKEKNRDEESDEYDEDKPDARHSQGCVVC